MAIVVELYSQTQGTTLRCNEPGTAYNGCEFQVQQLDGWVGPTPSVTSRKRMASDGNIVTIATQGARRITVSGTAWADATSNLWDGMRSLEAALDMTTSDGKIRVVEGAGSTRHAVVRLAAPPRMSFTGPRSLAWSAAFIANSPDLVAGA